MTISELEELELGLVFDAFIEQGNDEYEYPYKATQADFKRFSMQ